MNEGAVSVVSPAFHLICAFGNFSQGCLSDLQ